MEIDGAVRVIGLVKGGPDVLLARCTEAGGTLSGTQVPITDALAGIEAKNERMGGKGHPLTGPQWLATMSWPCWCRSSSRRTRGSTAGGR